MLAAACGPIPYGDYTEPPPFGAGGGTSTFGGSGGGSGGGTSAACGATPLTATGKFHTSVADIDYTGAKVTTRLQHKVDVDVVEDGCAFYLEVTLELQNPTGCKLRFAFGQDLNPPSDFSDRQRWGLHGVVLNADSRCPGFLDAREGEYSVAGYKPDVWFVGLEQVMQRQAPSACTPGVSLTFPPLTIRGASNTQPTALEMGFGNLTLRGDIASEGFTQGHCRQIQSCEQTMGHPTGDPGWCGMNSVCASGLYWSFSSSKCCPADQTSC